ncbi:MAG: hypothetical protein FJ034_01215 [Chloroflexi bacterium]|nr:hypothetical protein [Chloroflexota bacterium]
MARLRALLADGSSWERSVPFRDPPASADGAGLAIRAKLMLPGALPPAPVVEFALELIDLTGQWAKQPALFFQSGRESEPLVQAVEQLAGRFGRVPIYSAVEVEPWSRIPERRWALVPYER